MDSSVLVDGVADAGKVALGVAGVVTALKLLLAAVKWGGRRFVLWVCDVDVKQRDADHDEVMAELRGVKRALEQLGPVADSLRFIERTLVEKGLDA